MKYVSKRVVLTLFFVFSLLHTVSAVTVPDIIMEDIHGKKYPSLYELLDKGHYVVFYMLSKTWPDCYLAAGSNNQIWSDWGENKNTLIYMQYYNSEYKDLPLKYESDHGVLMPSLYHNYQYETGESENMKMGDSLVQTSGNAWAGGTNYIIKPDRTVVHLDSETSLREWLEENNVPKGTTSTLSTNYNKSKLVPSVQYRNNELTFNATELGKTTITIFDLRGRLLRSFDVNESVSRVNLGTQLSKGVYSVRIEQKGAVVSQKVLVQ